MKTQKAPKYNIMNGGGGAQSSGNLIMVQRGNEKNGKKSTKNSEVGKANESEGKEVNEVRT